MHPQAGLTTLVGALFAAGALAQTTNPAPDIANAQDDLQAILFLNTSAPNTGYEASLVCANPSGTTYVLGCAQTNAPNALCSQDPNVDITVTSRSTDYELQFRTAVRGVVGTVTQSCAYPASTEATCSLLGYLYRGASTVTLTSTVETLSGDRFPPTATIPITAGASNTGGECSASTTTSLSPTTTGGGQNTPANTGPTEANAAVRACSVARIYKVLVPVGIGALAVF